MTAKARFAGRGCRSVAGILLSVVLASCTSTNESDLQLANPSFNAAGAPSAAAAVAGAEATTTMVATQEGSAALTADAATAAEPPVEGALPEKVAYLPAAKPVTAQASLEAPAVTAALPDSTPQELTAAPKPAKASDAAKPAPGESPTGQVLENGGPYVTAGAPDQPPIAPKKKSFLSSFFGSTPANAATASAASKAIVKQQPKAKPLVTLATAEPEEKPVQMASLGGGDALPGVRQTALFEIKRRSGLDDESDVDLHEDEEDPGIITASAAGMARLAPNGLLKQRESVDVACLKPSLVRVLKTVEQHYGKKMVVTSGYRSPTYNRKVRGAKKSMHMYCAAADVQIAGVSKWELAEFVRSMPGRGGVGTYCHTNSVHIDVGPERDWNWRCRRRK